MFNHFGEYFGYLIADKAGIKACPVDLITVHDKKNKYSNSIYLYPACGSVKVLKGYQDLLMGKIVVQSFEYRYQEKYNKIISEQYSEYCPFERIISLDQADNIDVIIAAVVAKTIEYEKRVGKHSLDDIKLDVKNNVSDIINMVVYDCMFGNNDRHSQNWAVYTDIEEGKLQVYPLYDNERVLGLSRPEAEIKRAVCDTNLEEKTERECFSRMGISPMHSGVSYKQMLEHLIKKYPEYTLPAIERITNNVSVQDIEDLFVASEGITSRSEFSNELTDADELPQEYRIYAKTLYSSRREYARGLLEKYKYIKPVKRNLEEELMVM